MGLWGYPKKISPPEVDSNPPLIKVKLLKGLRIQCLCILVFINTFKFQKKQKPLALIVRLPKIHIAIASARAMKRLETEASTGRMHEIDSKAKKVVQSSALSQ